MGTKSVFDDFDVGVQSDDDEETISMPNINVYQPSHGYTYVGVAEDRKGVTYTKISAGRRAIGRKPKRLDLVYPPGLQMLKSTKLMNGRNGLVLAMYDTIKKKIIAVKTTGPGIAAKRSLDEECEIMQHLQNLKRRDPNSRHIIEYYGICAPESSNGHWLMMEYINDGINFYDLISHEPSMLALSDIAPLKSFSKQLLCGLEYVHSKNVIVGDFKSDNILVSFTKTKYWPGRVYALQNYEYIVLKLCDFGKSVKTSDIASAPPESHINYAWKISGAPFYRAYELLGFNFTPNEHVDPSILSPKVDIWALGVTLAEYASHGGFVPGAVHANGEIHEISTSSMQYLYHQLLSKPWNKNGAKFQEECLTKFLLSKNANHIDCFFFRPQVYKLYDASFFDFISHMICFSEKRLDASSLLKFEWVGKSPRPKSLQHPSIWNGPNKCRPVSADALPSEIAARFAGFAPSQFPHSRLIL